MGGAMLLIGYLLCGAALMDALMPKAQRLIRLWLGLCVGLILMMWLPTLYAFLLRFSLLSTLLGLGTAAGLFQSLFGFIVIMLTNFFIKRKNPEYALF